MQRMVSAEIALKSPYSPFFKGGIFSVTALTPLWQRGEGEIFTRTLQKLFNELRITTLEGCGSFFMLCRQAQDH
jgi:hypothetical protein